MNEIHTAPIDDVSTVDLSEEWRSLLDTYGYNYEIQYANAVVSDSGNGYVACKVETTKVPLERADYTVDRVVLPMCTCKASVFHHGPEDASITLDDVEPCKHSKAAFKEYQAQSDESQTELTFEEA